MALFNLFNRKANNSDKNNSQQPVAAKQAEEILSSRQKNESDGSNHPVVISKEYSSNMTTNNTTGEIVPAFSQNNQQPYRTSNAQLHPASQKEIRWPRNGTSARWLANSTFFFVYADANFLRSRGAEAFVNDWRTEKKSKSLRRNWFVPQFELDKLNATEGELVSSWSDTFSVRSMQNNYENLFTSFISNKWNIVFLTAPSNNNVTALRATIEKTRANIRLYSVSDEGLVVSLPTEKANGSNPIKSAPMDRRSIKPDAFMTPSRLAVIRPNANPPSSIPSAGSILSDDSGKRIKLLHAVSSNATSITYATDQNEYQAKVYTKDILMTDFPENKAKLMLSRKIVIEGVCWPISILRNDRKSFVGILVPKAEGKPLRDGLMRESTVREQFSGWNKQDMTALAIKILDILEELRSWNVLFGLLNLATITISGKTKIYFTDMDEWQIEGYPVISENKLFVPPELQKTPAQLRLYSNDEMDYQIAFLVFMLMMPGRMPYVRKNEGTVFDSIINQDFAFGMGDGMRSTSRQDSSSGFWRFVWDHISYDLGRDLYQTFARDAQHSTAGHRLSMEQWKRDLSRYKDSLNHPYDPESLKIYPTTFRRAENRTFQQCSFCGKQHPTFYFQQHIRVQVDRQWKKIPLDWLLREKKICKTCFHESSEETTPDDPKSFFICEGCKAKGNINKTYYTNAAKFVHSYMEQNQGWQPQKWCSNCKELFEKRNCIQCGEEFNVIVGQYRVYGPEKLPKRCPKCLKNKIHY